MLSAFARLHVVRVLTAHFTSDTTFEIHCPFPKLHYIGMRRV